MTRYKAAVIGAAMSLLATTVNAQSGTPLPPADIMARVPALSADFTINTSYNTPGGKFTQSQSAKYWRSSDGRTRQDSGFSSVITDLRSRRITHVNHQAKQATVIPLPLPANAQGPPPGTGGAAPPAPPVPGGTMEGNLGERIISGYRAIGTRVTRDGIGPVEAGSVTMEVWTAPDLRIPIYVKRTSSLGETIQQYENIRVGEPAPSVFEVPPDYTITQR